MVLIVDDDARHHARAQWDDDARADGGDAHAFGHGVGQEIEIGNGNRDLNQLLISNVRLPT